MPALITTIILNMSPNPLERSLSLIYTTEKTMGLNTLESGPDQFFLTVYTVSMQSH